MRLLLFDFQLLIVGRCSFMIGRHILGDNNCEILEANRARAERISTDPRICFLHLSAQPDVVEVHLPCAAGSRVTLCADAKGNGIDVGKVHTCELCQVSPFEYLTELRRNADRVANDPTRWLPWNYHASAETNRVLVTS